jgi:hypothetical protein
MRMPENPWLDGVKAKFDEEFGPALHGVLDVVEGYRAEIELAEMGPGFNTRPMEKTEAVQLLGLAGLLQRPDTIARMQQEGETGLARSLLLHRLDRTANEFIRVAAHLEDTVILFEADRAQPDSSSTAGATDPTLTRRSFFKKMLGVSK